MSAASPRALFRVAFTFAGALIGAGFASGQELLQFFIVYGSCGFLGIAAAGLLFFWLCRSLLTISYVFQLRSYGAFIRCLCGRTAGRFVEAALCLFLFAVLVIMFAAAGSIAADFLSLRPLYGKLPLFLCLVIAAQKGVARIAKINLWVTPFLALIIVAVSISSLRHHGFSPELLRSAAAYAAQPAPHWLLSCALYVSYNLALGAAVLVPLGRATPSAAARTYGSLLGGLLLATLSFLIVATLLVHAPAILADPLPMLTISCTQNQSHAALYGLAFTLALLTSSLSCLYGCAVKLRDVLSLPYRLCLPLAAGAALMLSDIGFSRLIALLFPLFGYLTLWIFIRLVCKDTS